MHRKTIVRVWMALALLALPRPATAQAASPDAAVRSFFSALEGRRWREAAAMVHPAALARLREERVQMARAMAPGGRRSITVEDLMRSDPKMPREVAEYQVRRDAEGMAEHQDWALRRFGVVSVEELERLSAEEAFARWLQATDTREFLRDDVMRQGDSLRAELAARVAPREVRAVLGSVPAGDTLAYVTYTAAMRMSPTDITLPERVGVLAARRHGAGWRVDPGRLMGDALFGGGNFAVAFDTEFAPVDLTRQVRETAVWPATGAPRFRARMQGFGSDLLRQPPTSLVLERLAPNGTVAARMEIPAAAWNGLSGVLSAWALLVAEPPER